MFLLKDHESSNWIYVHGRYYKKNGKLIISFFINVCFYRENISMGLGNIHRWSKKLSQLSVTRVGSPNKLNFRDQKRVQNKHNLHNNILDKSITTTRPPTSLLMLVE